jgi:hypothetical protein
MPMYFVHIVEGDALTPPTEGTELPDLAAMQRLAIEAVADLVADAVKRGERDYQGRLDVQDEHAAAP